MTILDRRIARRTGQWRAARLVQSSLAGAYLLGGSLLLGAGFLAAAVAPAQAGIDLLELPAHKSPRVAASLLLDVVWAGPHRLVAVGERGIIVLSDDDGASWRQASVPVSVTLTAVAFPTPELGWAVGHDGVILHSADGGASWRLQFDGAHANAQRLAVAEERLAAVAADPTADATALGDAEWAVEDAKAAGEFGPSQPLLGLHFDDAENGFAVGSYGQIFRTRDGGQTWTFAGRGIDNPEGYHYNAITRFPSGALVMAGEAGRVYRSPDDGATWQRLETGQLGHVYGVLPVAAPDGGEGLLAYGFSGRILRSDDLETWSVVPAPPAKSLIAGRREAGTIILHDALGASLASTDGGHSFKLLTPPGLRPLAAVTPDDTGRLAAAGIGGVRVCPQAAP